ncbi:polysaccharide biosynthesis/export family protein [Tamlana sp. 2_MG-2023]|uniref:polysaccharide biosynthesis/export family protein n=1 Tax=unclassified Tamlana TaxID=2614803 RepID=UPI0026E3D76E|nr:MULTISPECIES: polysaccharide biosynthesis/export family protein [unclassified Tamlana]MDO6759427.1 polysaccharide biosynthesis/export family protein [Tamlana sp. 2_MG-2023]MDO6790434.1 polysaccharide biosynthesis/export family protein [Tamlana sp. 1_MG-2023]
MKISVSVNRLIVLILILGITSSCTTKKDIVYFQNAKNFESVVDTDTFNARLKTGDILNIFISTLDLSVTQPYNLVESTNGRQGEGVALDYLIDPDGNIDYPVLGKVKLVGLTIEEAKEVFKKKFEEGKLLKNPVVIIRIKNYKISVLGQVNKPGVYPISGERVTILEAIASAGDLTITGRRDNVLVIRDFNGSKTYTRIDITNKELFNSPVYFLTQNDVVYVQPNTKGISAGSGDARIGLVASLLGLAITIGLLIQN